MNDALLTLGEALKRERYEFTTVTPATHARVNARPACAVGRTTRDIFGWSRPFAAGTLAPPLMALMEKAEVLCREGALFRSAVRFSTLAGALYVHSAFPSQEKDSVFFGPDTYRFAQLLSRLDVAGGRLLDLGCGSGAGGLSLRGRVDEVVLSDLNARALELAEVNTALGSGARVVRFQSDLLASVPGDFDLIAANPPYLSDSQGRLYRDGGGTLGTGLSCRMFQESLPRLRPGGRFVLYTGAPVVEGRDLLREALAPLLEEARHPFEYVELDPDVFGEELDEPAYSEVERISIISLVVVRAS